jgi:hypothetical protein
MSDTKLYIGFMYTGSFYSKLATWLVDGPFHHVMAYWYDENFNNYMAVEITPSGGIKLHSLPEVLKKYRKYEFYTSDEINAGDLLFKKYHTIGWKYDLSLLIKNLFRLLAYKWFGIIPKKAKVKKEKMICSEWVINLLQTLDLDYIKDLTPHLTSPEHLRQALIKNEKFYLIKD